MGSNEKIVKKVRPKPQGKAKYGMVNFCNLENSADQSVLALVGKPKKALEPPLEHDVLFCDSKVNVTITDAVNFEYVNDVLYSGPIHSDKSALNDWVIVFHPMLVGGAFASICDKNLLNFTYVRISPLGKVIERFSFTSPFDEWNVEYAYEQDGSVYLCGPSNIKDEATRAKEIADVSKTKVTVTFSKKATYTNLQLGKITGGKLDFLVAPKISDIPGLKGKHGDKLLLTRIDVSK